MKPTRRTVVTVATIFAAALSLTVTAHAQSSRPTLASAARQVIDKKGSQSAQVDVMMLMTRAGEFDVDGTRLIALAQEYLDADDPDAAILIIQLQEMTAVMTGGGATASAADAEVVLGDAYLAKGELEQARGWYRSALQKEPGHGVAEARLADASAAINDQREVRLTATPDAPCGVPSGEPTREQVMCWRNRGEARSDTERFKGTYRSVSNPNWAVSIYETCLGSGHLAAAPMWADVPSWILQSESDLVFFEPGDAYQRESVRLAFEAPSTGQASAVVFTGGMEDRFERVGPLEAGWQPEGARCYMPG